MRRIGLVVAVVAAAAMIGACGVNDGGGPERIDVGLGLDDTTTTSSTSTTSTSTTIVAASTSSVEAASTTIVQTEIVYLYFIAGNQLNSISIPLASTALGQVMTLLQAGPFTLGPPGAGLRTAVPSSPALGVKDNGDGTATVDLWTTFFDNIQQPDQVRAIAQIVLTLTSQRGIGSVTFTKDGQPTSVPLGTNEQSDAGRAVTRADYKSLTEADTATSTTTPTTPTTPTTATSTSTSTTSTAGPTTTTTVASAPPPEVATTVAPG
ncbi:MAG: GerMN domain-containing protein [Ilumatobacteraceae bacterium]